MFNFFIKLKRYAVYRQKCGNRWCCGNATNESFVKKTIEGITKVRNGGYGLT
uniref:Uncharacterized protein n=1 Tax=Macrostomum lignano TaxID=282301 RepID=A0A1I8FCJ9_9PLAT